MKIYSEIIDTTAIQESYINTEDIINNNIYTVVEKNGEKYTILLDQVTMKRKYISHKTKKIYDNI
jgi:hypothetical protein